MSIRPSFPARGAAALAFVLVVAGCSGGGDDPKSADATGVDATESATTSPHGEPGVASVDEAFAAMQDYSRRNNALILKSRKPPYDAAAWKQVDGGAIWARDAFDTKSAEGGYDTHSYRWRWLAPTQVYAPASETWPKEFAVAAGSEPVKPAKKQSKSGRKSLTLVVFQQKTEGAPWIAIGEAPAAEARVPTAAGFGEASLASDDQQAQALELARQLPAYWRTGKAPAGFADTKFIAALKKYRSKSMRRGVYRDITYTAKLFDGPSSVRTFRAQGGAVAVASYRLQVHWTGENTIYWLERGASVWGARPRPQLTETDVAEVSYFFPDGGGARAMGLTWNYALY